MLGGVVCGVSPSFICTVCLSCVRPDHNNYHVCLQDLNWDDLAQKKVPAPFVPRISNELDVSNFSEEFTQLVPQDSPAIVPPDVDKIFKVSCEMYVKLICLKLETFP